MLRLKMTSRSPKEKQVCALNLQITQINKYYEDDSSHILVRGEGLVPVSNTH